MLLNYHLILDLKLYTGNPISNTPDIVPDVKFPERQLPQTPDESIYSEVGTVNTVYSTSEFGSIPAGVGSSRNNGSEYDAGGWNGIRNMAFDPTYGGSMTSHISHGSSLYGSGVGITRPNNNINNYPDNSAVGRPASDQPTTSGRYHPTAIANGQSLPTYNNNLPIYRPPQGVIPANGQQIQDNSPIYEQQSRPSSHFETGTFEAKNQPSLSKNKTPPSNNISLLSYPPQQLEQSSPQVNIGGLYAPKLVKKPSSLGSYI